LRNQILSEIKNALQESNIRSQLHRIRRVIVVCIFIAIIAIGFICLLSLYFQVPVSKFTRDIATVADIGFYIGMLSTAGIMLLSAAAGICFFGIFILRQKERFKEPFRFTLVSGLITAVFALDDAFLLHDDVFPHYLNIDEKYIYLLYLFVLMGYLFYFGRFILKTDYLLLLLSFIFFGLMTFYKLLLVTNLEVVVGDSLKFMGILFWLGYQTCTTTDILKKNPDSTKLRSC